MTRNLCWTVAFFMRMYLTVLEEEETDLEPFLVLGVFFRFILVSVCVHRL